MVIQVRRTTEADEACYEAWSKRKGLEPAPSSLRGSCGFMAYKDETPLAVGFLIPTYSSLCLIEFMQTNPDEPKVAQGRAMLQLIQYMIELAKTLGYRCVTGFTPEDNTSLQRHYDRIGGKTSGAKFVAYYMEVQ